jgi:hypothetical protein
MPLQPESLIKICRGTRRMGNGRPVLVVTADTMDANTPFSEFYVFHQFPDLPFLYSRTSCAHPDALYLYDFGQYPEVFSAKALLEAQFCNARDQLEHEVSIRDRALASDLFYSASPMLFEETGQIPFMEFAIFQQLAKEREIMFKFSRSDAIHRLEEKLQGLPEAVLEHEPKYGN